MDQLVVKALVSGVVVAAASEAARRSSLVGAVIVSLPLTSILALLWLYRNTGNPGKVADLSWSILLVVVPSLTFFAAVPLLMRAGAGVPLAVAGACAVTALAYGIWVLAARLIGLPV